MVELMVVVAIMGTLAAIAIPAYNEYRKSAKKTAYKSDLMGLHKGWLAFGVELDNFCDRESNPSQSTIPNVGMTSLTTSKLYGSKNAVAAYCSSGTACTTQTTCTDGTTDCNTSTAGVQNGGWVPAVPAGNGPGKHNFIGFGADGCTSQNLAGRQILGEQNSTSTVHDIACNIGEIAYDMGVYGQLTGAAFWGISINSNSVLSAEINQTGSGVGTADTGCT